MTQEQRPTALLDWSLRVDCPACDKENDLAGGEHDSEHDISMRIFSNAWNKLNGWEVTCEHCGHKFKIEEVEY